MEALAVFGFRGVTGQIVGAYKSLGAGVAQLIGEFHALYAVSCGPAIVAAGGVDVGGGGIQREQERLRRGAELDNGGHAHRGGAVGVHNDLSGQ